MSKNKIMSSHESVKCNIFASLAATSPHNPALSCLSPGRFCRPSKSSNLHLLSFHPDCSSCSLGHITPPPTPRLVRVMARLAGQAWPAYDSLIGSLISSISARGSR